MICKRDLVCVCVLLLFLAHVVGFAQEEGTGAKSGEIEVSKAGEESAHEKKNISVNKNTSDESSVDDKVFKNDTRSDGEEKSKPKETGSDAKVAEDETSSEVLDEVSGEASPMGENKEESVSDDVSKGTEVEGLEDSTETDEKDPAEKELSEDAKSIVQSIKVSTNKDLVLWLSGLGLGISGGRSEHENALLEYYKLPSDALIEKVEEEDKDKEFDKEKTDEDEQAEKDKEKEDEESDLGDVKEKSEEEEEEKEKLIKSEVTKPIAEGETTSITITNADEAEYFTYEKVDEHVFVLKGNVEVIVQQENKKRVHRITANKLVYNETLRVGSAVGNVKYRMYSYEEEPPTKYTDKATEEFTGEVVSFGIDEFNSDVVHGIAHNESEVSYGVKKDKKETLSFRIFAPHISKSPHDVITISDASLTSSILSPPLYRIRLRKMWVLNSSGEWAIARATVFLGDIPVLWFPFFINPGDKLFFHPAIGYKMRGGGYINTTTYFIGKSTKKEGEAGFLDIFDISNSKKDTRKIIKGLYLREPEAGDLVRTYPPKWELKYILDYYTNVGLYSALEGTFPSVWKFDTLSFAAGIGYSHTVYNIKDSYFNNHIDEKGKLSWNLDNGYIYGIKIPFRYNFKVDTKLKLGETLTTALLFEQYSDSFVKRDFFQRAFDFDWQQVLDPNKGIKDFNARPSQISSYYWRWNNDITIPANKILGNYIKSFSISSLRLQLDWKRKNIEEKHHPKAYKNRVDGSSVDQKIEGSFFYPRQAEVPSYSASISGTLFSLDSTNLDFSNGWDKTVFVEIGKERKEEEKKKAGEEIEGIETETEDVEETNTEAVSTKVEGTKVSIEETSTETDSESEVGTVKETAIIKMEGTESSTDEKVGEVEKAESTGEDVEKTEETELVKFEDIVRYVPFSTNEKKVEGEEIDYKSKKDGQSAGITYDIVYPRENITVPSIYDFDWKKVTLLFTYKMDHALDEKVYLNDKKWKRPEDVDFFSDDFVYYGYLTTDNTFTLTHKLTTFDSILSYDWDISLNLQRRFLNLSDKLSEKDRGDKEKNAINYTKEELSNKHTLVLLPLKMFSLFADTKLSYVANFDIGKNVFDTKEPAKFYEHDDDKWWKKHTVEQRYTVKYAGTTNTLGLDIELPPRLDAYSPLYTFDLASYFSFSMKTKIFKKKKEKDTWFYDPLDFSSTVSFFEKKLSLKQTLNFNYEQSFVKDMKTTVKAWWFSFDFIVERNKEYVFDVNQFSFNKVGEDKLRPSSLNTSFNYDVSNIWFWRNRINLLINFKFKYDHAFLEFTKTQLLLSYKFEFSIHKVLKLSFSFETQNDLMFLYYKEYADQIGIPPRNFWEDIIDGLNLFDTEALKRTPFKLNKLSLGITQDFGGWVLDVLYSGTPKRKTDGGLTRYEWKNTLEFGVYWKPISDLKTSVYYREDKLSLDEEIKKK